MENYLPEWGLRILSRIFFDKMYIWCYDFKKTFLKNKNSIFEPKYVRYKISVEMQNRFLN